MRSFAILLLCCATAVLAASTTNNDQKKDKRHLLLDNHSVSTYSLPYGLARYSTRYPTGYPTGYPTRYPTGLLDTRVLSAGVPLDNSLVLVCPSGWRYEDLLYRRNFGNVIGLNELVLYAQPGGPVSALPPISARDEISGRIIHADVPSKPTGKSVSLPSFSLTDDLAVSGGIESLLQELRQFN